MRKNNRKIILLIGIVILFGAVFILGVSNIQIKNNKKQPQDSTGLIVSKNAIYVPDQAPMERIRISLAYLKDSGFIVIHEDNNSPGAILGTSALLEKGEVKNFFILLNRSAYEDETLYAMLHVDDGDGLFDPEKDLPAIDEISGETVMMIFTVSKDFPEPSDIQL